ncbi:hypothetical protein TFLX_03396 [Thermoflexales bacterium]|nr:hypothetical protein TFLX_03396 [Thermoflexales bacterium]
MKQPIAVPQDYRCPLCVNHVDEVFYASILIDQPICEGCQEELFLFEHHKERPADQLIEKMEQLTGLTWDDCRVVLLRDTLETWRTIEHELPQEYLDSVAELGWTQDRAALEAQSKVLWYAQLVEQAETESLPKKTG